MHAIGSLAIRSNSTTVSCRGLFYWNETRMNLYEKGYKMLLNPWHFFFGGMLIPCFNVGIQIIIYVL